MNKKIIFYIDSMYRGGANRVIANLVDFFAKESYDVVLVNDIIGDKENEYPVNEKAKRIILLNKTEKKHIFLFDTINRIKKLRLLIKEENPVAVVSFMGPPNYRMLFACIGIKTRKIVSVRNDPYIEYGRGIRRLFTNIVFKLANGVVFQTEQASSYFFKNIKNKSCIIFNPINEVFYNQTLRPEEPNIVFLGRLQEQKNPEMLLDSFLLIKDRFPEHRLLYYGEGELLSKLKTKVDKNMINDRVFFKGLTNNVPEILSSACCFVLCSNYEGMPNALMEAMAIGVPVISTDCPCGGPKALIENEEQGLLIRVQDSAMLSIALEKIISSKITRDKMRKAAKERSKLFQPAVIYKQWESFILYAENKRL